jgi:hypothetical protein
MTHSYFDSRLEGDTFWSQLTDAQKSKGVKAYFEETTEPSFGEEAAPQVLPTEKPSIEQQAKDIKEGKIASFEYSSREEVPEVFKDKIVGEGVINGKPSVRVRVAQSLADYELGKAPQVPPTPRIPKERAAQLREQIKIEEVGEEVPQVPAAPEMPKEIADLYAEAAGLRFTLNALKMQMGGKGLTSKAKAEYDRTQNRLTNIESQLSQYESEKEIVEKDEKSVKEQEGVKKEQLTQISSDYGNYLLDLIEQKQKELGWKDYEQLRKGLAKNFEQTKNDRNEQRAISALEEIYVSYLPEGTQAGAYQVVRKNYEKQKAEAPAPEKAPEVLGIDEKETIRQMKPFTDEMARIERELQNRGLKIDTDYDNEIIVTDAEGNILDPEEIPSDVADLIAGYEQATMKLGEFDQIAREKALAESRKIEEGVAEVVTPQVPEAPKKTQAETAKEQTIETDLLIGGQAAQRRKDGKYTKDGVEFVRNEKGQGLPSDVTGEVRFTNEVSLPFRYKLVEAETLQPSHQDGIRNPNHFIPEAQPKNRNDVGSLMAEDSFCI